MTIFAFATDGVGQSDLGRQLVMLGPDGQPAADLLEDLGGIPPLPRARRAAGVALAAGLGLAAVA